MQLDFIDRRGMAIRRMLHKSISISKGVNSLTEFSQLLFSWIIPHLDDFGKIDGDPAVLKALVMPMSERSIEDFEVAIQEILTEVDSVIRYEIQGRQVIQYMKFDEYQTGLNKRTVSKFRDRNASEKYIEIQNNSQLTESNIIEKNGIEHNISEPIEKKVIFADNTSFNTENTRANPKGFKPMDAGQAAALDAHFKLEPYNPASFHSTYLKAYQKGLPADKFYEFVSEIQQSSNTKKPGAVFNSKVNTYFEEKNNDSDD